MVRSSLILIVLTFVLMIGYTNCGVRRLTSADLVLSSNCVAKAQADPLVGIPLAVCEDHSAYLCVKRVFAPGLASGEQEEKNCIRVDGREVCVRTTVLTFDTEAAREGAAPGAFDPGGDYNRVETQCHHSGLVRDNITLVAAESSTLESSLNKAIQSCRERRTP